jgi:hypothetical protein
MRKRPVNTGNSEGARPLATGRDREPEAAGSNAPGSVASIFGDNLSHGVSSPDRGTAPLPLLERKVSIVTCLLCQRAGDETCSHAGRPKNEDVLVICTLCKSPCATADVPAYGGTLLTHVEAALSFVWHESCSPRNQIASSPGCD